VQTEKRIAMIKKCCCLLLLFYSTIHYCQHTHTYDWGYNLGGTDNDSAVSSAIDENGNVYVFGHYRATVDFDFTTAESSLTAEATGSSFIAKYDNDGNLLWVQDLNGDLGHNAAMTIDNTNNALYLTGSFENTMSFGSFTLNSNGDKDVYVIKQTLDGTFLNAYSFGDTQADEASYIHLDNNELYISGDFRGTIDVDITTSQQLLISSGSDGSSQSNLDNSFLVKLNLDLTHVWSTSFGGYNYGSKVTTDNESNIYVTGLARGTMDADPSSGEYFITATQNTADVYLIKLSSTGDFIWAGITESYNSGTVPSVNDIAVDSNNNIYLTGAFSGRLDFDFDDSVDAFTNMRSSFDGYVAKYDPNGNHLWLSLIYGVVDIRGRTILIDNLDNIYATGSYRGTARFGSHFNYLWPVAGEDAYLTMLNTEGDFIWKSRYAGSFYDRILKVSIDPSYNLFLAGTFHNSMDFNPYSTSNDETDTHGESDAFLIKLSATTLSTDTVELQNQIQIYPNPSAHITKLSYPNTISISRVALYDLLGKKIKDISLQENTIDISGLASNQLYLLKITTDKGTVQKKLFKK
jgi:hypothetical protein